MIEIVYGDLLLSGANYICHQVNCQGVMGSGVAKQIRARWPSVYGEYRGLCDRYVQEKEKLLGQVQTVVIGKNTVIANVFGQLNFGRDGQRYTDLAALRQGFNTIVASASSDDKIAMPYRIGCGLGGGDWGGVVDMLSDIFREHHLSLYRL